MEIREGVGLAPDLWVPAADAVNYGIAALRNGTITTRQPLPSAVLQQEFVPENPRAKDVKEQILFVLVVTLFVVGGSVWAYFVRRKPLVVTATGAVWFVFGIIQIVWPVDHQT